MRESGHTTPLGKPLHAQPICAGKRTFASEINVPVALEEDFKSASLWERQFECQEMALVHAASDGRKWLRSTT